jgi:hypothetical protein
MQFGDLGGIFNTRYLKHLDDTDHLDDIFMGHLRVLVPRSGIAERHTVPFCVQFFRLHPPRKQNLTI